MFLPPSSTLRRSLLLLLGIPIGSIGSNRLVGRAAFSSLSPAALQTIKVLCFIRWKKHGPNEAQLEVSRTLSEGTKDLRRNGILNASLKQALSPA